LSLLTGLSLYIRSSVQLQKSKSAIPDGCKHLKYQDKILNKSVKKAVFATEPVAPQSVRDIRLKEVFLWI